MKKRKVKKTSFYACKEWKTTRKNFISQRLKIDGGLCQHCKAQAGNEVDHIVELNDENYKDKSIRVGFDNLQLLCKSCHSKKTQTTKHLEAGHNSSISVYQFDEYGNVINPNKTN